MPAGGYPQRAGVTGHADEKIGKDQVKTKNRRGNRQYLRENVGLVRFELTIDGSLRHASVLQRVIILSSADPLFIICEHEERKDRWSPSPFRARPQPLWSRRQLLAHN